MRVIQAEQGSDEWLQARVGVLTASRFRDACDTLKSGKQSQVAIDYAYDLAAEIAGGAAAGSVFVSAPMRRGTELEPFARAAYEGKTGYMVDESGLILSDCGRYGFSPDGLIDDDGLLEVKCPANSRKKVEMWATGNVSEYMHQMQGGMWITGRAWCDFVMFDPSLSAVSKHLYIKRIPRDDEFIADMQAKLALFLGVVDQHVAFLREEVTA